MKPISTTKKILKLPGIYLFLIAKVLKQKRVVKMELQPELGKLLPENDGSLTEKDFKKVIGYYGLGVPAILGEAICALHGTTMTAEERKCSTYLGSISGLLDDLFDDPKKEVDHLREFILYPEKLQPKTSHEVLLQQLYIKGLANSKRPDKIKKQALKVFEAQQQSQEQQYKDISIEQLREITFSKGGSSFLYYRHCLKSAPTEAETKLLYHLGGLMQLGNDIFDVWEDHQAGIRTEASIATDIRELRSSFKKELEQSIAYAHSTNFPNKNIEQFNRLTSLALSRVFVCLDQFENLQKNSGGIFCIEKYSRKQLICDMQKPTNQLKSIKYYLDIIRI
jgi:hypothetical protein